MKKNIDSIVGKKIRSRRIAIGMSQSSLSEQLNITFQQIQKYESGANSLNVFRLYELCKALKVPSSFFFDNDDFEIELNDTLNRDDKKNLVSERELLEIIKALQRIKDPTVRKKIADLVRSIAES